MIINREPCSTQERLVIDLEMDFANRTAALDYILNDVLISAREPAREIYSELYNADSPSIWIQFRINGNRNIFAIAL